MRTFLQQLRARRLFQWGAAYLAGAWLLLQLLDLLAGPFGWPDALLRGATAALAAGFLAALVLAWYHGEKGAQRVSGPELLMLAGILVLAAAALARVAPAGAGSLEDPVPTPVPTSEGAVPREIAQRGSIAVLPFADLSPEGDQGYFSDGLTEELLNVLSQRPELRVISRTSAFSFKGSRVPLDSIARALRVAHVLEGSVRTSGSRIRITAQLIDAASGYHEWSRSFDRELEDVFAVQDEIARAIVGSLGLGTDGESAGEPLAREQTRDPQAHALVLQAMQLLRPYTREGTARAAELLKRAIERDPAYARAYAELGRVYSFQGSARWGSREELMREARDATGRALALDPDLPEAHYVLGFIAHYHDWDLIGAEVHYRRAIELNPGYARVHSLLGYLLMNLGRPEEALVRARHAVDLDPLDPGVVGNLAALYSYAGRFDEALESFETELSFAPSDAQTLASTACIELWLGRRAEAIEIAERAARMEPDDASVRSYLAYVYGRAGRETDARGVIRSIEAVAEVSPLALATAYAGLGDADRVFSLLERAAREKDSWALDVGVDPVFEPFRADPRMTRLLRRIGLPAPPG